MKLLVASLLITLSASAFAQEFVPERNRHPESFNAKARRLRNVRKSAAPSLDFLPGVLTEKFQSLHNLPAESCGSDRLDKYLLSLSQAGKYQECATFAQECAAGGDVDVIALSVGASCLSGIYKHDEAFALFERGYGMSNFAANATDFLFEFAMFAQFGVHASRTDEILGRHPTWSADEKRLAKGLINLIGEADMGDVTKAEARAFLEALAPSATPGFAQQIKYYRVAIATNEYEYDEAVRLLARDARGFATGRALWSLAWDVLYRISDDGTFPQAGALYRAYLPFAHSRSMFPGEQNLFTYSQIQGRECASSMMTSAERAEMNGKIEHWREGRLSFEDFAAFVRQKVAARPTSDLLTIYGNTLSLAGDAQGARQQYWQAHQACPFNNRSHWGLALLNRQERYESYPEFRANEERVLADLRGVVFPKEIEDYVMNWKAFPERSHTFIKHGLRPYARFLKQMNRDGYRTYVKLPFELLSDTPPNPGLRDRRIGPPDMPGYRFDNRLWDDVRGSGGQQVVADHDETLQSPHGAYNLMIHEVAHQFHAYMKNKRSSLGRCLDQLYSAAKGRNVFPDAYAGSNVEEYFAQGVTYYSIPASAPARFGLNVSWLQPNDPDLKKFIESFIASNGELNAIQCPI